MKVRLLATTGQGYFEEVEWDKPEPTDDEIEVKAVMTGVCRSDIDMMNGTFGPLPLHMQGHEGLGQITKIGKNITVNSRIYVGAYVATRGEPAYADYYNVRSKEFCAVPEANPAYILEPIACGANLLDRLPPLTNIKILILGSGFLAWVAAKTIQHSQKHVTLLDNVHVIGNSNIEMFRALGVQPQAAPIGTYDVVIDLKGTSNVLDGNLINDGGTIICGTPQKGASVDYEKLLWKSCQVNFPSPRNSRFHLYMGVGKRLVDLNKEQFESFWTHSYNRETEWKKAFEDGHNRAGNYGRGYIYW